MQITDLIEQFSISREKQSKAIFSTLFIAQNKLQTIFDNEDENITLKQFMLLTMVRRSPEPLTFTQLGGLLGCSRQNIKKIASVLELKGFVEIKKSPSDSRACAISATDKLELYFDEAAEHHQKMLGVLFQQYTDEELKQLFDLLMRLYSGIDLLAETVG